jgi:hypothetical protein
VETEKRGPPPAHFDRQPSVLVTGTKLAVAVSPIPSSDGRYRPEAVLRARGLASQLRLFRISYPYQLPTAKASRIKPRPNQLATDRSY